MDIRALLTCGAVTLLLGCSPGVTAQPSELTGVWTAVSDEDGTPADVFELRGNGTYVNYGIGCNIQEEMPYHVFHGDLYVTSEIPDKGPIAIVFRPSRDGKQLTFTSPRTRNNAVYERLASNPCEPKA